MSPFFIVIFMAIFIALVVHSSGFSRTRQMKELAEQLQLSFSKDTIPPGCPIDDLTRNDLSLYRGRNVIFGLIDGDQVVVADIEDMDGGKGGARTSMVARRTASPVHLTPTLSNGMTLRHSGRWRSVTIDPKTFIKQQLLSTSAIKILLQELA